MINKGLYPVSSVEVQGKVLNQPHQDEICIMEMHDEPQHIESGLPELNILSFKIETSKPAGRPRIKEDFPNGDYIL